MAKKLTIDQQIKKAERHLRYLKKKVPLGIGKYILNNYQIPMINKDNSVRKNKNGKIVKRNLHSIKEFTNNYTVIRLNQYQTYKKNLDTLKNIKPYAKFGEFIAKRSSMNLQNMNEYVKNNGGNDIF